MQLVYKVFFLFAMEILIITLVYLISLWLKLDTSDFVYFVCGWFVVGYILSMHENEKLKLGNKNDY